MKKWEKSISALLAVAILISIFTISGFAIPAQAPITESVDHLADDWLSYNNIVNSQKPIEAGIGLDGTTTITLHRADLLSQNVLCCTCGDEACAENYPMEEAKLCVEYTQNGDMITMTFGTGKVKGVPVITAAITPTAKAKSNAIITGNFYYQPQTGHRSQSIPFAFSLGAAKKTIDQTRAYADDAVNSFSNTTVKAIISNYESYSVMLCTPYFASGDYQTSTPVSLTVNDCTAFSVSTRYDDYQSWGKCIWIDFTPLTTVESTTVFNGTFDFKNSGGNIIKVPFSFTQGSAVVDESVEYAQQYTNIAQNQTIDERPDEINYALYGTDKAEYRIITGNTFKDCAYQTVLCGYAWVDDAYLGGKTVDLTVEGTDLVTAQTIHKAWSGDASWVVWLSLVPTEKGKAVTEDTLAEGTVRIKLSNDAKNGNWQGADNDADGYASVDFSLTLSPEQELQPEITISPKQSFTFMQMTKYWAADGCYDTRTKLTTTDDEGLVEFYAYTKTYSPWSTDCVFIDVVPTEAAKQLSEDKQLNGTYTLADQSNHERKLAYHILLTAQSGDQTSDMSIADQFEKNALQATPLTRTFGITEDTQSVSVLLQSSWQAENAVVCSCGETGCKTLVKPENLVFNITEGSEYATISAQNAYKEEWGMDCTYLTLTVTEAAKQKIQNGEAVLSGTMYFENSTHKSHDYQFCFILEPQRIYNDASETIAQTISALRWDKKGNYTSIVVEPDCRYKTLLFYNTIIPYMSCQDDGMTCPINHVSSDYPNHAALCEKAHEDNAYTEYTAKDLCVEVISEKDWLDVEVRMENGVVNLYATPTEKANTAKAHDYVWCNVYFEKNGHRTIEIPVIYYFYAAGMGDGKAPRNVGHVSMQYLTEMPSQLDSMVNNLRVGSDVVPINAVVDPTSKYRGLLMTKGMIAYVPCQKCGNDCAIKDQYGVENLKVVYTKNDELVSDTTVEMADYDGWGDCIYVTIAFNEQAVASSPKTLIQGYYYFEKNGHTSAKLPFAFSLYEQSDELTIKKSISDSCEDLVVMENMAWQVDAIANALRNGRKPDTLTGVIQPTKQYRALMMTKGLIAYVPCTGHGVNCPMNKQFTADDITVTYTSGKEYADLKFEFWNYDGWGDCVYLYVLPTEEALSAPYGSIVSGTIHFTKDGHTTKGIPFSFRVQELPFTDVSANDWFYNAVRYCYQKGIMRGVGAASFAPKKCVTRAQAIQAVWQMEGCPNTTTNSLLNSVDQVKNAVNSLQRGNTPKALCGNVTSSGTNYAALMTDGLIPYVPCTCCGNTGNRKPEFTTADLQAVVTEGSEYVNISFKRMNYSDWGEVSYMVIEPTAAAKNAPEGASVSGYFFFKNQKHTSQQIPFRFAVNGGFTDMVQASAYEKAVLWGTENGIVSGTSAHQFSPNMPITREQLSTLLCRYAAYLRCKTKEAAELDLFSDFASISTWAKDAVSWAVGASIMLGKGNHCFAPQQQLARAELAQSLMRFDQTFIQDK